VTGRGKNILSAGGLRERLASIVFGRVLFDEPMSRHTSIGIGGKADAIIFPERKEELAGIVELLRDARIPFMPIGNGTNLLVRDGGYRGAVISLQAMSSVSTAERGAKYVVIHAGAGAPLAEIVKLSTAMSLTGMEFCAGIPGSVGGAVRMNAGAYGREIKDVAETVALMNESGEFIEAPKSGLKFTYRNLYIAEGTIIIGASFTLTKGIEDEIRARIDDIMDKRKDKHPLEYRNAGSIFKNPNGDGPAGKIIDELGMKGTRVGNAKISEKHGNFIVNLGNARASDVIALIEMIKTKVAEERGIRLQEEVKIIGEEG